MAHVLIFGMTESGKTTLAKRLAGNYQARGVPVIVLDSLNDPEWPCDFQTTDPDEFLRVFWSSKRCAVFVDEAGDAVGRYNTVMQRCATRGRHWGHSVHFISQRGVQIAPTVRDQCGHLFLLTSSVADGKVHANEWNQPKLLTCNSLGKGNYFHCTRFGTLSQGSLFGGRNGIDTDNGNGNRRRKADKDSAPKIEDEGSGNPADTSGTGDPADTSSSRDSADTSGAGDSAESATRKPLT